VTRTVTMGPREALRREQIEVGEMSFVAGDPPGAEFDAEVRIRYGASPVAARVEMRRSSPGDAAVFPAQPLTAAAPGQAAVLYDGEEVLGGGRILRVA
jgi:tRNA-uridine 2-sulfurtransferase